MNEANNSDLDVYAKQLVDAAFGEVQISTNVDQQIRGRLTLQKNNVTPLPKNRNNWKYVYLPAAAALIILLTVPIIQTLSSGQENTHQQDDAIIPTEESFVSLLCTTGSRFSPGTTEMELAIRAPGNLAFFIGSTESETYPLVDASQFDHNTLKPFRKGTIYLLEDESISMDIMIFQSTDISLPYSYYAKIPNSTYVF